MFALTPRAANSEPWSLTRLDTISGSSPSSLSIDAKGGLIGVISTANADAATGAGPGLIFQTDPPMTKGGPWTKRTLYTFKGGADGSRPLGPLVTGADGTRCGTTEDGGSNTCRDFRGAATANGCGTVFALTRTAPDAWTKTVLHDFTGDSGALSDARPTGGVVLGQDGFLYGAAGGDGGNAAQGEIYRLSPPAAAGGPWTETILYTFMGSAQGVAAGAPNDGAHPNSPLTLGPSGKIYGTTQSGGTGTGAGCASYGGSTSTCGTLFVLTEPPAKGGAWTETQILSAPPAGSPGRMAGGLILRGGTLYGLTQKYQVETITFARLGGSVFSVAP